MLGRVRILILDGGQLFQRVLRESVKNSRIVGGGGGVKIFRTVGMFLLWSGEEVGECPVVCSFLNCQFLMSRIFERMLNVSRRQVFLGA